MNIIDLLFPVSCLGCKKVGKYFCQNCEEKIEILNRFDTNSQTSSVFRYVGVIKKGIIKIKYNFAFDLSNELAELTTKNIKVNWKNVTLIPIPLHKSRQNWRGFNQSEIVGKLIAQKLNLEFKNDILVRLIQGQNQVGLAKSERVRNMSGKYAVNPEAKIDQNRTYLVFDDVATTGSTIKEAINVLKKSGVKKVFGLTIAR